MENKERENERERATEQDSEREKHVCARVCGEGSVAKDSILGGFPLNASRDCSLKRRGLWKRLPSDPSQNSAAETCVRRAVRSAESQRVRAAGCQCNGPQALSMTLLRVWWHSGWLAGAVECEVHAALEGTGRSCVASETVTRC